MTTHESQPQHWRQVYQTRDAEAVSWYRPRLEVSLDLLRRCGLDAGSRVIDVGGGASTLVDDLLATGVAAVTVVDLADQALAIARERLGPASGRVNWIAGDITRLSLPAGSFSHWHDRAVLHFLTEDDPAEAYARQAAHALAEGGHAVIGGFAPDGPRQCSGLPVARRSPDQIAALLAPSFELIDTRLEHHRTPAGAEQAFNYAVLRRR
jgi:SAM-dependent methyltransferase